MYAVSIGVTLSVSWLILPVEARSFFKTPDIILKKIIAATMNSA